MIEILTCIKDLKNIKCEWDALNEKSGNLLQSFDWFYSCAKHFYPENKIFTVVYRKNNEIKCILPLAKVENIAVPAYELLGSSFLFEPSGAIYETDESFKSLLSEIKIIKYPIFLSRITHGFNFNKIPNLLSVQRRVTYSSYIKINKNWNDFFNDLKSKRRSDYRRALNRAKNFGQVSTQVLTPDSEQFDELFTNALNIEASGWKGIKKSALLYNQKCQNFFREFLKTMCLQHRLRIAFLSIEEIRIAMLIGIVYNSKFWILKIGYDEEYAVCSPGMLLTMETIKFGFEQNLLTYEFLGSYEKWQDMWPIEIRKYSTVALYPFTVGSFFHFGFDVLRYFITRMSKVFNKIYK